MRRLGFTAVASIVVFALVPATALARHHHRHHRSRHHHSAVHIKQFGTTTGTTGPTSSAPGAGTVQSFDSATGRLTLALNDGSTVSGNVVSGETELECEAPESMSTGMHEDGDGGSGSGSGSGENGGGNEENCSTANLTPGAVVQEAELRVSSAGANWERVVLDVQSASQSAS